MPTTAQIRGLLLEEVLLHLLRATGYQTVEVPGDDPTLQRGPAGLCVRGRGARHQIDAIADFLVQQPFSNPQRLLVEAKCYDPGDPVRLPVVRNALGTLRDVSEYWVGGLRHARRGGAAPKRRYHYQYAVFSATRYTRDAQELAYAQDIYLIPLHRSRYIQPVIAEIRRAASVLNTPASQGDAVRLSALRQAVRASVRGNANAIDSYGRSEEPRQVLRSLVRTCHSLNVAMLATLGSRFPVFLVPADGVRIQDLSHRLHVEIYWDAEGWYITGIPPDGGPPGPLFSFDLPEELFRLYDEAGSLSPRRAWI